MGKIYVHAVHSFLFLFSTTLNSNFWLTYVIYFDL